jgi:hypothetical protein
VAVVDGWLTPNNIERLQTQSEIWHVDNNPSGGGEAVQWKFLPINPLPEDDPVGFKL